tara:strand:- start:17 stop:880 length:864 start_codon:yes stop_codon:yes gene_type:complete
MRIFKKLKLGIVGHGFVGKATDWGFNRRVEKFIVDPKYNTDIDELEKFDPKLTFVCVPTPMGDDGDHDSSIIESVVKELTAKCTKSIIVIKSTVLPSVLKKLTELNNKIIYNPEFLREKHANKDFANSEMIIFGGDRNTASKVSKYYLYHSRCKTKEHVFMDIMSASLIKYSINTFLASKVIFFNELFNVFRKLDSEDSWESVIKTLSLDKRIGASHMNVPGHDGKYGFGGACFPKDSTALIRFAETLGVELSILKTAIKTNNRIRGDYDDLDDREKEQNVSFDDKI